MKNSQTSLTLLICSLYTIFFIASEMPSMQSVTKVIWIRKLFTWMRNKKLMLKTNALINSISSYATILVNFTRYIANSIFTRIKTRTYRSSWKSSKKPSKIQPPKLTLKPMIELIQVNLIRLKRNSARNESLWNLFRFLIKTSQISLQKWDSRLNYQVLSMIWVRRYLSKY